MERLLCSLVQLESVGGHDNDASSYFHSLENWRFEEWGDQVTVVSSDMRDWVAPEKADIIVSELLGSFGDNELSPECLDGAQHFLKGRQLLSQQAFFFFFADAAASGRCTSLLCVLLFPPHFTFSPDLSTLRRGRREHPLFLHVLLGPAVLLQALQ